MNCHATTLNQNILKVRVSIKGNNFQGLNTENKIKVKDLFRNSKAYTQSSASAKAMVTRGSSGFKNPESCIIHALGA